MVSDETLAAGVQQGNRADMEALAARYYEPLLRFLFRLSGGNQPQAEDMAQETFLRMMRGIAGYDPARPFKPWLYAIAGHIAQNQATQAETRLTVALPDEPAYPDRALHPEAQLEVGETQRSVAEGLRQLPLRQREVIALFYFEALSQKEIAGILNIPVGTVKSRLSLGLKQLRGWLEARQ